MKKRVKKLIPLLLTLVLLLTTVPLVEAKALDLPEFKIDITKDFADANFLKAVREALGKGPSDRIYTTDVSKLKSLNVASKGISSLDGIRYFSSLEELKCENNNLTTLDVSKNTKLKVLHCWINNLTSLDVSKHAALVELYCDKNKLSSLDVTNNPNLKILHCFNNNIKSLDLSQNINLERLACHETKMTSLDVRKNTKLGVLFCDNNNLTTLDLSKNTKLTFLRCGPNKLTSLNLSNNPELTELYCNNNNLTSLDLSENTKLEKLWCSGAQLTTLDVSKNKALKVLKCNNNYFPSETAIVGLNKPQLDTFEFNPQASTPSAPKSFEAKPGDKKVSLSWSLPDYGGTDAITSYEVSNNDGAAWLAIGNTNSYTFTGLINGQSYNFKIRAVNNNGKGLEAETKSTPVAKKEAFYKNASSWAIPELEKAYDANLIPDRLIGVDMTKPISREEFAELSVKLYETSTGWLIKVMRDNPFTDTTNYQILKAYEVGITDGTSATKFSPEVLITREQCAAMLYRAIQGIDPDANYSIVGIPDFPDQKYIANWAIEATKYMSKLGIILGNNQGEFMPKPLNNVHKASGYGMASREAAVLMAIRTFEKIK